MRFWGLGRVAFVSVARTRSFLFDVVLSRSAGEGEGSESDEEGQLNGGNEAGAKWVHVRVR